MLISRFDHRRIRSIASSSFGLFLLIFLLAAYADGQQAVPTPAKTPSPPDGDVVKISTNLIQLDVTVLDSKGKVVTDLRPDEIEIFENGEKQSIKNFSFVSAVRSAALKDAPVVKNAPPVPTTILRPEQVRRTIALVVDDLSLSFESAYYTRRA